MPRVTFSSPTLDRAATVFSRSDLSASILSVAEAHRIPLPHACGEGACGVCAVDVLTLSGKTVGSELTDKEKMRLFLLGKITAEEIYLAESKEIAPRYRLACQYRVRFEDILATFPSADG